MKLAIRNLRSLQSWRWGAASAALWAAAVGQIIAGCTR